MKMNRVPVLGALTSMSDAQQKRVTFLGIAIALAIAYPFIEQIFGLRLQTKLIPVLLFIVLALGLNVVVGFAGLLDLGYAAFFAIGAYTVAFLTSSDSPFAFVDTAPVNFWIAMVAAAVVAALFGVLLGAPTLRLRGDYLAIVTLGFGEIVPLVIRNTPELTKGVQGMKPIGFPELPGLRWGIATEPWYFLVLGILLLSVFLTGRLRASRIGRAWMAIREDEVAAASMGINPVTTKLFAFSLGASFSGFAGSVWAGYLQVISPEQFDFSVSIFVLLMIVLGGMGNIPGVIAGGLLLGGFDRVLSDFVSDMLRGVGNTFAIDALRDADISRARTLIFGTALVILMLVRPEGILPSARVKAELHAAEEDETEAAQQRSELFESQR
ncbi:MAG TPA: branched-chain amino acid ABC transporter permease [Candidatus Limnocylindria bacterium]|jgi:branched-chain amino acid transport system permease protein|nr:branched-chain amino acid ABC transporter permease [Candidatus Limnocylindria bacterium]